MIPLLRGKISLNLPISFITTFSIPYLLSSKYAGLGSKVGFIFGSIGFIVLICVYFFVPECKGKTLEEIDLLFMSGIPIRDFGKTDATAMMELETTAVRKADVEQVEET